MDPDWCINSYSDISECYKSGETGQKCFIRVKLCAMLGFGIFPLPGKGPPNSTDFQLFIEAFGSGGHNHTFTRHLVCYVRRLDGDSSFLGILWAVFMDNFCPVNLYYIPLLVLGFGLISVIYCVYSRYKWTSIKPTRLLMPSTLVDCADESAFLQNEVTSELASWVITADRATN
jgi:hypothetical protein